jgi:multidrug efflux pump subunit AcrA (membrane-fusion protein)
MTSSLLLLTAAWLAPAQLAEVGAAPGGPIVIQPCLVSLIDEAKVSTKEAGVLVEVAVAPGARVKQGDLLARIDDVDAKAHLDVAKFKLEQAEEEAKSDVNVRYSRAAAAVAEADYRAAEEANRRAPNTYSATDLRRLWLTWNRATLEIEKSQVDLRIAGLKAKVSQAETKVAEENLNRRQIISPVDGIVVEVKRRPGEWVQPELLRREAVAEETAGYVVHVVRLDRLRVEGLVDPALAPPGTLLNRTVTVAPARGRAAAFQGKVVFVSPLAQNDGKFRIWAEVQNQEQNGEWILRPGLTTAEMTIQPR